MPIQLNTFYHPNFLLDIHSNLVPKLTTVTIKATNIFMDYIYKKKNKKEIVVTILPTTAIIRIRSEDY